MNKMPHNPVDRECVTPLAAIRFIPILSNAISHVPGWSMKIKHFAVVIYDTGGRQGKTMQDTCSISPRDTALFRAAALFSNGF
jgi:hypothetical protein